MKYFFLTFSLLFIVVGCSSLTEQERYDDHTYPRSGDIKLGISLSSTDEDDTMIISGTINGQYTWYDDLIFSGDRDMGLGSDENNLTVFSGTGIWVVGQKTLGLSLASGSLFFGDGAVQNTLYNDILLDVIESDSLVISQDIDGLSLLHIRRKGIQTKSLLRDEMKDYMTLRLGDVPGDDCLFVSQSNTTVTCPDFTLTLTDETVIVTQGERGLVGEYTIDLKESEKRREIIVPTTYYTLGDILLGKNQQ